MPSAGVLGPKLRGWHDHRVLLEVGVTVDRGGRRETGLEPGELDHGQHDGDRDVLAVSTAGMLVRRDVWDELGGLDRALPLFRDDIDFGWRANLAGHRVVACSQAVVYHAQAAAAGVRRIDSASPYPRRVDRQAALRTMVVNASPAWLPWIAARLLVASLVRALAFVVTKRPLDAWDETRAALAVFGRPRALAKARSARRKRWVAPHADVRRLFAPRGTRFRYYAEAFSQRVATVAADDPDDRRGLFRRVASQPGVLLVAGLLLVALIAQRQALGGGLHGGALLPAPAGASDLWNTYTQHWHPTGFGSWAAAPPYLALLAMLAAVLFGSAPLAVQVLVLGCVPLAGLSAYLAAKPLAPVARVRVWVAATYALLPVVTGSVSGGRLGGCVVAIVLPWVLSGLARALLPASGPDDARRDRGLRAAWVAAVPLTIATAFDPTAYLLLGAVIFIALVWALARRAFLRAGRALVLLAAPPVLLLPWTARLVDHPALVVAGVGQVSPGLQSPDLAPINVLLMHPGGPGMPPVWLEAVVVLAGLAGLLQLTRPGPARLGWLLAVVGVVGGLIVTHLRVSVPSGTGPVVAMPGWPGAATTLVGAGLLMAAAVAGARLRDRLSAASFGWRQPVALLITVAAVATPVAAAALWLNRGVGPLLRSGGAEVLPAFVRDADASRGQPRTIVLRPPTALPLGVPTSSAPTDTVTYALLRDRSPRLGDGDLPPDPGQVALLDTAVADLAGGFGRRAATELAHAGVRYVLTPERDDAGLATRIATAGGLLPKTHDGGWVVWQVQTDAGRLAIATEGDDTWRLADGSGAVGKDSPPITVPYAPNPRLLVLAEAPSANWRAVAIGATGNARVPLAATTIEGMQAFALPTAGGQVVVQRAPDQRANWLVFQLVALLVVLGAAIPSGRRSDRRGPGRRGRARAAGRADDAADVRDPIGASS
ncbi:MAG TPA: glycosyltransferase, partial [Acidothermaceae bacterium]